MISRATPSAPYLQQLAQALLQHAQALHQALLIHLAIGLRALQTLQ